MDSVEESVPDTRPQRDEDPVVRPVPDVNDVEMGDSDDEGMPALQEVSDSSDEEYDDSDEDNNDHDRVEQMMQGIDDPSPTPPPRPNPNRRTRMEDDADEERDRRHPSQRTNQNQTENQTPRWQGHGHPLPGGGFAFHIDAIPATGGPTGGRRQGLNIPLNEFLAHLNLTFQSSLIPEAEDPERAKFLVDALEIVPPGLVRRLERVGSATADSSGSGGDTGCAICWEKLLQEGEEEKKIVSMPCAHVFHAECLIPWFSRPRQTTCPTCRFDIDSEGLTRRAPTRRPPTTTAPQPEEPAGDNTPSDWLRDFIRDMVQNSPFNRPAAATPGAAPAQDRLPFPLVPPQQTQAPTPTPGQAQAERPPAAQPQQQQQPRPQSAPQPTANPQPQSNLTPGEILAAIGERMSRNLATTATTTGGGTNQGRLGEVIERLIMAATTNARNPTAPQGGAAPNVANLFPTNGANIPRDPAPTENAVPGTANANLPPPPPAPQPGLRFPFSPFPFRPVGGAPGGANSMGIPVGIGIGVGLPFPFGPGPPPTRAAGDNPNPNRNQTLADMFAHQVATNFFEFAAGEDAEGEEHDHDNDNDNENENDNDNDHEQEHEHVLSFGFDVVIGSGGPPEGDEEDGEGEGLAQMGWDIVDPLDVEGVEEDGEEDQGPPPLERIPEDETVPPPTSAPHPHPHPHPHPTPGTGAGARALPPRRPGISIPILGLTGNTGGFPTISIPASFRTRPRGPARREKKDWTLPLAPGLTLREKVEKREREMGLRCSEFCCAVGPHDDDPPFSSFEKGGQVSILLGGEGKPICVHTFHPSCLVSSSRISSLTSFSDTEEESHVGAEVEVSCPVCKHSGVVSRSVWEGGC